jgi:putative hemolysin
MVCSALGAKRRASLNCDSPERTMELIYILICLFINALLASFEMAFVSVPKTQLRQLAKAGHKTATVILKLRENPERTLSVIQVGITLVGMISAAIGGAGAEESFSPYFERQFGWSESLAEAAAIIAVVVPLTLVNVVLGELVPKTIALRDPARISMLGARWINWADKAFSPVVSALEYATKGIMALVPKKRGGEQAEYIAQVEIGHLSQQTQQYVLNLVGVENRRVKDVMVPWQDVNFIQLSDSVDSVLAAVMRSGHTRLPVCRDEKVVGVLHTKEFIAMVGTGSQTWQEIIRPIIEIQENEPALRALRTMQDKRSHLSLVVSSQGQFLGIATLEDIIEEVIGEVFDEDDDGRIRKILMNRQRLRGRSR